MTDNVVDLPASLTDVLDAPETSEANIPEATEVSTAPPATYKVKVDGKEIEVTHDELVNGYSRQADYTRKAQTLAEERKAFEQSRVQHQQYTEETMQMRAVLLGLDHKLKAYDNVDWATYTKQNPAEAQAAFMELAQARETRRALADELTAREQADVKAQQTILVEGLAKAREQLYKQMPDFDAVRPQILETGKAYGFSEADLHTITDHRIVAVLRDAMNWRRYQDTVKADQSAAPAPAAPVRSKRSVPAPQGFDANAYLAGVL